MELDQGIEYALEGKAILFVGAGFSQGATNISGQPLQGARAFAKTLALRLNLPEDVGLDDAAEEFAEEEGDDALIELLHNEFTASAIENHHLTIPEIPWRRIYTTNYDNVLELSYSHAGHRLNPVTPSENIRRVPKDGTMCVHLNGYIDKLDAESLWEEFKLTDTSYASASLVDSPWISMFRQDLRAARAVFFIGYSLSDLDIRRILFERGELKEKTFFVLRNGSEDPTGRRASRFGIVIQNDVAQFADVLQQKRSEYEPMNLSDGVGFAVEKFSPPDEIQHLSDRHLFDLFLFGDYKSDLAWDSLHDGIAYLVRRDAAQRVLKLVEPGSVVVAHSELGNGKTILLEQVKMLASELGLTVFTLARHAEDVFDELCSLIEYADHRTLIVVDDYPQWIEECAYLGKNLKQGSRILLSSRSSVHDVLQDRLEDAFRDRHISEFCADRMSEGDVDALVGIFDEYGFWAERASLSFDRKRKFVENDCGATISPDPFTL